MRHYAQLPVRIARSSHPSRANLDASRRYQSATTSAFVRPGLIEFVLEPIAMSDVHRVHPFKHHKETTSGFQLVSVFFKFNEHLTLAGNELFGLGNMYFRAQQVTLNGFVVHEARSVLFPRPKRYPSK